MIFPIIKVLKGQRAGKDQPFNGRNNPFRVLMCEHIDSGSWLGILCQEVYESRFKWRHGLLGTVFSRRLRERMELMGHAVECQVASTLDGHPLGLYELGEAKVLTQYAKKGLFVGLSVEQLRLQLIECRKEAATWALMHAEEIYEWRNRYGR